MPVVLLDGGLATTLQEFGLQPSVSPAAWLLDHPGDVAGAHRAFAEAGARVVLTATLRCVPGGDPDPMRVIRHAVAAARSAGVEVRGSLGPIGPGYAADGWATSVRALVDEGVPDVVLETFVDLEELRAAVDCARDVAGVRSVVASAVPAPHGRARDGRPLDVAFLPLRGSVDALGVNCVGPDVASVAIQSLTRLKVPLWAKPSKPHEQSDDDWAHAIAPLAQHCAWLGGCCGAGPSAIRTLGSLL